MMNPASSCRGNSFMRYANAAAELERASDFSHAARLWLRASLSPASRANTDWASCRAEVCNHRAKKPEQAVFMSAEEFNALHPVGSHFLYKTSPSKVEGKLCKTVCVARRIEGSVMVEINRNPYYVNVLNLHHAGFFSG